jgi:hypothetical protein
VCLLAQGRGIFEPCSHEVCPFWEPGGAALAGGCVLGRASVDPRRNPELLRRLEQIRRTLEAPDTPATATNARAMLWSLFVFDGEDDAG